MRITRHRYMPTMPSIFVTGIALYATGAWAEVSSTNILSNVTDQFHTQAASWGGIITGYATWLFWTLGTISLVFTGVTLILKKADIGEFFAEFIRFILFFGFFLWLLQNAASIGSSIIHSLMMVGANASQTGAANPSAVMDIGFTIFHKVMEQTTLWSPVDSMIGAFLAGIILICIALIAANMTIMLCSAWILLYGGIFFLGFGGSRWTSDIAINYYKSLLSVGASLMAMILMVGIAQSIITNYYNQMSAGIEVNEIATIMVVAVILLLLVHRVPGLISGILTGASISHSGIGSWSAGHAMGAMGVAATAAMTTGAVASTAARHIGGGGVAMLAAFQSAQHVMSAGDTPPVNRGGLHEAMGSASGFMSAAGGGQPTNSTQTASADLPDMPNSISAAGDTPSDEIAAFVHKNSLS